MQRLKRTRMGLPKEMAHNISLPVLKRAFPFRLSTTSYILPAGILPNVRALGSYFDEMELVLFGSGREDNLPTNGEIKEMGQLGRALGMTYNVHLPTDLFIGHPNPSSREKACETALRFYERTLPLQPTCHILHLEWNENQVSKKQHRSGWLRRLNQSLEFMVASGLDPRLIAVENLAYPLEWVRDLVEAMGMSFCLDMGHLLRYGYELREYLDTFLGRTSMVHLHGVRDGVDHRGLEFISKDDWASIVQAIETYGGGLSVEVFSLDDLRASLVRMEELRR